MLGKLNFIQNIAFRTTKLLKDASIKKKVDATFHDNMDFILYPKIKVSLCGRFNAGKSALINSMLSNQVVISRPISSTGVITRIYYNNIEKYSLIKRGCGKDEMSLFSVGQLKEVTIKDNFNNSANVRDIVRVDIGIPNDFLKSDIELFDTPGLDDTDESMSQITINHLNHSDFIIFVIDALQLMDLKKLLMKYYNRLGKNVIFVANKMDAIDESEQQDIKDLAKVYFSDYFNPLTYNSDIFFVSTKTHDSQMDKLSSFCRNHITADATKIAIVSRLSILKSDLQHIYEDLKNEIEVETDRTRKNILKNDKMVLSSTLIELKQIITENQLS